MHAINKNNCLTLFRRLGFATLVALMPSLAIASNTYSLSLQINGAPAATLAAPSLVLELIAAQKNNAANLLDDLSVFNVATAQPALCSWISESANNTAPTSTLSLVIEENGAPVVTSNLAKADISGLAINYYASKSNTGNFSGSISYSSSSTSGTTDGALSYSSSSSNPGSLAAVIKYTASKGNTGNLALIIGSSIDCSVAVTTPSQSGGGGGAPR